MTADELHAAIDARVALLATLCRATDWAGALELLPNLADLIRDAEDMRRDQSKT